MQTVVTLPILQTVSDTTTHYLGLQPKIRGTTTAEYVNSNLSFNPSSNTLTLGVNLNILAGAVQSNALADASVTASKLGTITRMIESAKLVPASPGGNVNIDILDATIYYFTANSVANLTFNLRGNATTPLDRVLNSGQAVTTVFLLSQGSSQYFANISIDGIYQSGNTRWMGNVSPKYYATLANSMIEVYSVTTVKTSGNNYTLLGSNTIFGVG